MTFCLRVKNVPDWNFIWSTSKACTIIRLVLTFLFRLVDNFFLYIFVVFFSNSMYDVNSLAYCNHILRKKVSFTSHRMKSHLSVDWMVTEWWLNGDWMMTGKVDFSRISVTIQWPFSRLNGRHISVTFQSAYFLKNKIAPDSDRTRDVRIKGKAR